MLREYTYETVMATYCLQGHANPLYAPNFRPGMPGRHRLPGPAARTPPAAGSPAPAHRRDGAFDRGVVIGRKPVPVNPHAAAPPGRCRAASFAHVTRRSRSTVKPG